ncbi:MULTISPECIES: hypothetical protein [Gordonia]|uniref:hypothetical protein n=1 Tax=Gordonia TaxID=2053 RepID=UPI0007E3151F|nr:hypothetical protein [Gordonia sp. LAM0048]
MAERFGVEELGIITGVGDTLARCSSETRALWSGKSAFDDASAAMPASAIGAACAGKDGTVRSLLGRAAARMDQVSQTCYQAAGDVADTEESLASGFRAISEF